MVARSHIGAFIFSSTKQVPTFLSLLVLEAIALSEAVLPSKAKGMRRVFFEGDSKLVIEAIS